MPASSGELWGHHLMPQRIEIDILLPTGVVLPLRCSRDQTLHNIKTQVWREGPKYPFFHLLSSDADYVFTSVTLDAKKEEFHDESRRLCDLHLFVPFLKLVEPNASTKQENILNSQISVAIGIPVNQFDELENPEVVEYRREAVNICKEIVEKREESPESHSLYKFSAQIAKSGPVYYQMFPGGMVSVKVWFDPESNRSVTVRVAVEAYGDTVISEALEVYAKGRSLDSRSYKDYVLKICGRQEYLLGPYPISQYKYIREVVRKDEIPQLELVERNLLFTKLPTEPFHIPAYYRRTYRTSETEKPTGDVHLWRINCMFQVQVLWATYINATDTVCVKAGIFHGDEALCELLQTSQVSCNTLRWNETLRFQISVPDMPRSSRLCVSVCSISKNKKRQEEYCMLAWGNINLFDFKGRLITGKVRLDLWPAPMSLDSVYLLHPLGITGSSLDKGSSSLELEFDKYSLPLYYPKEHEIYSFAEFLNKKNEDAATACVPADDTALEELINKDPLCEISEQDKALVWKYREYCLTEFPQSLPRLVAAVKWNSRENTAIFYDLLKRWRPVTMETALALLDCKSADIFVREFAVRNLDHTLHDSDVHDLSLQLVQSLKYEPYLQSPLAMFLLRRALVNRLVGHFFFWHLRSEISGKSWLDVRFGLILEAYCRGLCGHLKDLYKQVEALEKLTVLTETLKEKRDEAPRDRLRFLSEQIKQADFLEVLENLSNPVSPNVELGSLKVESCRIMDSAKRPLWLVWQNNDPLAQKIGIGETAAIFKNGDDLRQDMLTLQVVRMMDELWRSDNLDLKMLSYTCLATGKQVGLIQVVKRAQTVYTIQRKAGALAAIQVNSKQLHKWLAERNKDENRYNQAIETFKRSCAGYCVATFILGIGDRNPDNIMVSEDGHIFHIDFGHFLGHFKKKFGINRERVPFVLTEDFLYVIAKGAENPRKSPAFQEFQKLCGRAYIILRRHANLLISLFTLMLPCGIAELQSIADVDYLRKTLAVDMNEAEALNYFQTRFSEAYGGGWITKLDWFFHSLNHIKDAST
ncbi:unnamed protein product [Orchesella dallaii]